ncbi:MAG: deoxyguanosinetriphosphate triphosphohydrolase, partial [Candidatus Omnitrophica bacterium]|nr:deoxyguanosinetriphosphate triphosphohydrolase [Candidatus Omnitrophota bacterium]
WDNIYREISKKYGTMDENKRKYLIIRSLIDMQVTDLIDTSLKKLQVLKPANHMEVKRLREKIITFSRTVEEQRVPLRKFLISKLYQHYRVVRMSEKAKHFIGELFDVYISKPKALPFAVQKRIAIDGKKRAVCDYIAGMTDRYALDEYKKLFDPYEKV